MAEYIECGAAIKCAEESYKMWCLAMAAADGEREINKCYKMQDVCKAIGEVFKIVPAADVAPVVHGGWIPLLESEISGWNPEFAEKDPIGGYMCSVCKEEAIYDCNDEFVLSKFCPYCGAKMDEE